VMSLYMQQLLNPLFYSGSWPPTQRRHPDSKRQRRAKINSRALRQARALKAAYVPLRAVDPTVYLEETDANTERAGIIYLRTAFGSDYRRRVRESCDEVVETTPLGKELTDIMARKIIESRHRRQAVGRRMA
jgi:hypothetical protein